MNTTKKNLALAALVSFATLAVAACSAPADGSDAEETTSTQDNASTAGKGSKAGSKAPARAATPAPTAAPAAPNDGHYTGSFVVDGNTYLLAIDITVPSSFVSQQTIRSSRFHLDALGRCDAYTDSIKAPFRIRLSDAQGTVLADDTQQAWVNVQQDLDRQVECPDGLLVNPRAVETLTSEISRDGIFANVAGGKQVSLPFGYGARGFAVVNGAANYRATSPIQVEHEPSDGLNQSDATIASGVVSVSLPKTIPFNVGTGNGMDIIRVTLTSQ